MARKRLTREFFEAAGKKGGKKAWASMTTEQRSAEMKRRAKGRATNAALKRRAAKSEKKNK
jgi:hypothetical protein